MSHESAAGKPTPEMMRQLRAKVLTTPPAEFGIAPPADCPRVYGVVMDWPIGEPIASVVSFSDGNASLYTTSTFGVLGGVGHQSVRAQACSFVKLAVEYVDDASPTSEFPYPALDRIRFYLLTFDGVRVIDEDLQAVTAGGHRLTKLFAQGQNVLTELRQVTEQLFYYFADCCFLAPIFVG